ncbi:hypothetical protein C6Y40_20675 [Alteromonas alba]|uniref:DUF2059 domain-containing protein n=1 Tax=Alteromonas alba TaxID=2079529 RepID=A0A2S9V5I7_9ALTE|nr:DUF2059 domain-containing protein [Alteromonas alba]PRO71693.1 hypothetical protein C6Y40_20675 [Alteromonas alba]
MRKALMIIIATLGLSGPVVADSGQRETVEALLIASGADSTLDAVYAQFDGMFANMAEQLKIEESERASFKKHMQEVNLMLRKEMNWDTLKAPMIDLYMAHYTENELQDMLAFYQSETGQSVVKKMPEVMAASMQITQQLMKDVYPKIMQMSKAYAEDLKKQRVAD